MNQESIPESLSLRDLYLRAVEKKTSGERAAFLDGACGGDLVLRDKIEALLREEAEDSFLENAAIDVVSTVEDHSFSEGPGTTIGRYKLLQELGEGGMGAVYMAEQTEPVTRKVALKIIKLGMDTKQVVARFEAERQALAMMDHPNIARVLDAGATDTGRPYFVMELVRGVPITEYCDKNKLSTEERLKLFLPICQAIQHAHQKGVIHRDIKPSNVMVTLNDGVPHPMVIDFGIAKATNQKLTEKTLFTNYAQMIGTPAYMSPEQAEMSKLDIDTRTDVYSLGVLLYELLTGTTPFPAKELLSLGYGEMQKVISEKEPPKPSTCLSTMENEDRTVVAKNRSMEASALGKMFQGDLDWIMMKALEKDRTHRYETVNGLASDIRRHLNNEPVSVVAPTFGYQLRKFARRNRRYARMAAAVSALLIVAVMITSWQAVRATRAMKAEQEALWIAQQEREEARKKQLEAEMAREGEQKAKEEAVSSAEQARANELHAERLLYAFEMQDVSRALARDDRDGALRLLEKHIPKAEGSDIRNWEWRYLWGQTRGMESEVLADFPSAIHSLSVSHDGRYLAVGRYSNGLAVIDIKTQQRVAGTPVAVHGRVRTAFSPVEGLLAFNRQLHEDRVGDEILLWDTRTGKTTARFSITGTCAGIQFSADGQTLFVGNGDLDEDSQIETWDVGEKTRLTSLPAPFLVGNLGTSETFVIDDQGFRAAYTTRSDAGKGVKLLDLKTGEELMSTGPTESESESDTVIAIALSPDGQLLATCDGWGAEIPVLWNVTTGERLGQLKGHRDHVKEFVFWPDGRKLATAGNDQSIRIWDVENPRQPRLLKTLYGHRQPVWQLTLSSDGRTLYSGALKGRVLSWDSESEAYATAEIVLAQDIMRGAWFFEPGGRSLVALKTDGQVVRVSGASFERQEVLFEAGSNLTPFASFSMNRRYLGVGHYDGRVAVWNVHTGRKVRDRQIGESSSGVATMRNDGTLLLGTLDARSGFVIADWDLTKPAPTWSKLFTKGIIPFGAESPNGEWVLRPHEAPQRRVWLMNRKNGDPGALVEGFGLAEWAGFSADSEYFAIGGPFDTAAVFETASRKRVLPLSDNLSLIQGGAFSPDNTRLATGGRENIGFKLYDLEIGQLVFSILDSGLSYYGVQYSPDGNLIGAQSKGKLHLWRAPSWEEITAFGEKDSHPESSTEL